MNRKVAKLLQKHANARGENVKVMKARWLSLSAQERTRERKRMETELAR